MRAFSMKLESKLLQSAGDSELLANVSLTDSLSLAEASTRRLASVRHNRGKLLNPFGSINFADKDISARIDSDRIRKM